MTIPDVAMRTEMLRDPAPATRYVITTPEPCAARRSGEPDAVWHAITPDGRTVVADYELEFLDDSRAELTVHADPAIQLKGIMLTWSPRA